jgi:hypothetical protein
MKSFLIIGFTLTQLPALNLACGLITVAVWFVCADYYLIRCAPDRLWLEGVYGAVPFVGTSIFSLAVAGAIWKRRTPKAIGTLPTLALPEPCPKHSKRELLAELELAHEGVARHFFLWVRSGWRGRLRGASWAIYWLGLLAVLIIPALHSETMELVAYYASRVPPCPICKDSYTGLRIQDKIVAVDVEVRDAAGQTEGPWALDPDPVLRRFVLNKPGNGTLAAGNIFRFIVYAGDFPHVERKLEVRLLQHPLGCTFPANSSATSETVEVRAGKSTFELICPPTPGSFSKRFNVRLDLQKHSGTSLWPATIQ